MLEMTNRLARGRAMGIATMPILRAAIETDAATMADIAERDAVFAVGADETLEVFQIRGNEVTSLLHLPAGSPRIAPLYQRATRLSATGDTVTLVAGAPIDSATAAPDGATVAGEVALATRVDFAPAISLLAQHAREAWLRGPGIELRLVGSSDTAPDTVHAIPLRTSSELGGLELTLVAVSSTTEHGWLVPMRVAGVIIAGLALACYIWRRWRWQVIPAT
jgi:hypothetical protein